MSFILEALKKSDKNNQQGGAPTLHTQHPQRPPQRKRYWPLLISAALLVNVAALLLIIKPWTLTTVLPRATDVAKSQNPAATPPPIALSSSAMQDPSPLPATVARNAETALPIAPVATSTPGLAANSSAPHPMTAATEQIYAIEDLPPSIKNQLPQLHMSVHAYSSDHNTAMVRINDKILREGGMLEGRYQLIEITEDGAVLDDQGYRFKLLRKSH